MVLFRSSREYGVHATFNVLTPFAGSTNDEAETFDLRKNPFQEEGDDGRVLSKGPTTRAMARRIQKQWGATTPSRAIHLYMFKGVIT